MFKDQAKPQDAASAALTARTGIQESVGGGGVYTVTCLDKDGNVKWAAEWEPNLVVNEGLQDMNTQYFKGSTYTAAFYLGLIAGPGVSNVYDATDTLASHAGWTEFTNYSGARKAVTFGSATSASPSVIGSSSALSFTISSTGGVVGGAFLCTVSSGSSGVLFSEANFESPGDRTVVSGDTLNVTYTFGLNAV